MLQFSAELLALSGEPALLARGGKILFANEAACTLLGADCQSRTVQELFGKEIAGMQAPSFVGETEISEKRVLLRVRAMEGMRVIFLTLPDKGTEPIGEAFLYTLRSEMMQLGVSAAALRTQLDPAAVPALNGISIGLYRINRTLTNLSLIRGGAMNTLLFLPQPLDLVTVLQDLIDTVRLEIREPEIYFSAPKSLPIQGDPGMLELLLLNLLSNCFRHAEGCTRIRVTLHSAGEQVILSVDDDGCGIPGDRLSTVLERFRYQTDLSETGHGPGFGLSAAREIARIHGGTLLLESRENIGTAVRVSFSRLPRAVNPLKVSSVDYDRTYNTILTGLADCLPPEAFSAEHLS